MTRREFGLAAVAAALGATAVGRFLLPVGAEPKGKFEIAKAPEEWRKILTSEQYYVLREHGTERAGSSPLDKQYGEGDYHCAGCDLPVFSSKAKYDSKTGWPSFWEPLPNAVGTSEDRSWFMTRTEVHCRRCGGHLGHVFNDGPEPTGLRYCMNGVAMKFIPASGKVVAG